MSAYRATVVTQSTNLDDLCCTVGRALFHLEWRHHGIGLLQAYLSEPGVDKEIRVHLWHPALALPGIEHSGAIHDHRFMMQSTVLYGAMGHTEWHPRPDENGEWQKFEVLNARAGTEEPTPLPGYYSADRVEGIIGHGFTYSFPEGSFHQSSVTDLTVTIVKKTATQSRKAQILCPRGSKPVHAFDENAKASISRYTVDVSHYVSLAQRYLLLGSR